jgi:exodeoxyribonuclease VII large subunit
MVHLVLSAAPVQGERAPEGLVAALDRVQRDGRADLVIVARGGGSAEDLVCFNDERVARAVFACRIPVVSAVGHETDWTIIDLVADLRAPTPSAAAELCTPLLSALCDDVLDTKKRAHAALYASLQSWREESGELGRRVERRSPIEVVRLQQSEVARHRGTVERSIVGAIGDRRGDLAGTRMALGMTAGLNLSNHRHDIEQSAAVLGALDPMRVLERGYAAIEDAETARLLVGAASLEPGRRIRARFADGSASAVVDRVDAHHGVGQNGR